MGSMRAQTMDGEPHNTSTDHHRFAGMVVGALCVGLLLVGVLVPLSCRGAAAPRALVRAETRDGAAEPTIRVRIARSRPEVEIECEAPIVANDLGDPLRAPIVGAPPITLTVSGGALVLTEMNSGESVEFADGALLRGRNGQPLLFDGGAHPGEVEALPDSEGEGIDLIETADLETYIAGVIARELYPNWSATAYEAQAIVARSYALHERQRRARIGSRFHIESTTQDQAYGGETTNSRAVEAVRRTRGLVLTYRGRLLRTYYSSTCGGRAASARDTWPTGPGFGYNLDAPIQAHERDCTCSFSPRHHWTVERSEAELVARLRAHGARTGASIRSIRSVSSIESHRRNRVDRPSAYRIADDRGKSWVLSAEQLRLAFNTDAEGYEPIQSERRVLSGDLAITVSNGRVVVEGRGFGHGVGLCQFGTEGFARAGRSAREILAHYYPGSSMERAY